MLDTGSPAAQPGRETVTVIHRPGASLAHRKQTALLLGASRGLGLGLAREYLSRGWRVIATARDNATSSRRW